MHYQRSERWSRRTFLRGLMVAGTVGWFGGPLRPAAAELREPSLRSRIKIVGFGGGASHALNTLLQTEMPEVEVMVADTDLQALRASLAPHKIPLGARLTHGLGAGADPTIGRQAALAGREVLSEALDGADLVIVLAGLGGGTGTGAAPVVSRLARGKGGLTAALVTTPFPCEGERRMAKADAGLRALDRKVDLLITLTNHHVPNGRGEEPSLREAFRLRKGGWRQAVHSLTEVLTALGLDDPDMPKVRTLMAGGWGRAFLGSATARGANRAVEAARHALSCPLSDETSLQAARGALVAVAGGIDLTLLEVHEAACLIAARAREEAQLLFSSAFAEHLQGELRVTVLASGV